MCRTGLILALMCLLSCPAAPVRSDPGVPSRTVVPFDGVFDPGQRSLTLTLGQEGAGGAVVLEARRSAPSFYEWRADIRHVGTPVWDVAAVLNGRFRVVGPSAAQRELTGEMSTQYTLLNYKPVRDMYVSFSVRDHRLLIDPFWFGVFSGKGSVDLLGQHDIDGTLEMMSADLDDFSEMLRARGVNAPLVSGIITASVAFKGPLARPWMAGRISAYNGRLNRLNYDTVDVRFSGTYPVARIEDGRIDPSDGPRFRVSGAVDIADMSRMGTQFRLLQRELVVADDENGHSWAFRRMTPAGNETTQLKSFISRGADGRSGGDSVIGLQKHIGF